MQNSGHAVYFLQVDFDGGLHVAEDMLHGLLRIYCVVTGGKQSQLLVLRLKTEVCQKDTEPLFGICLTCTIDMK